MSSNENPSPFHDCDETVRGGHISIDSWVVFDRPRFDGLRMHPIWHQQDDIRGNSVEITKADGAASQRRSVLQAQEKWLEKMASKRESRRRRDSFWSGLDIML
jgi:hypothetical protein